MPQLRFAEPRDAARLAEIFRPYVLETAITFAVTPPVAADFLSRIATAFPFLVLEQGGEVVAYAYASPHRALPSYGWGVEVSLYVNQTHQRRGHATRLYAALFGLLREQGILKAYAVITLPNAASVALHQRFGFRFFAEFREAGFKLGEWRSVAWGELALRTPLPVPPPEVEPIAAVREKRSEVVQVILAQSSGDP